MRPASQSPISFNLRSASLGCFRLLLFRSALIAVFTLVICTISASAQGSAAGSNWNHLKALPVHTRLHVWADHMNHTCYLLSVDDAALVCGRYTFPRAEVKSVKLTRYGVSYAVGAAAGAGAGVGIGLGLTSGDSILNHDKGEAAGIGLAVGAGIGALVAGPGDLFRGPTVYRRQ